MYIIFQYKIDLTRSFFQIPLLTEWRQETRLHKADIISELHQRKVKFSVNQDYPVLKELLDCEVHGIQSVPALIFSWPNSALEEFNLQMYEVLGTGSLHDISNHVKNLYEEIPFKFEKETKKGIVNIINVSFKNKETWNSADHRESLLTVCKYLQENHPDHTVTKVSETFTETQEILYLQDSARSPQKILWYINTSFRHAMLLTQHSAGSLKN